MGLLDFIKTPEGQGLLSATFGGLAGAGRGGPVNTLGRAGMAGLLGYGNAQDRMSQEAVIKQQLGQQQFMFDRQKTQAGREDAVNALASKYYTPATQGAPGVMDGSMLPPELQTGAVPMAATPAKPAGFDLQGYAQALMGVDPKQGVSMMQNLAKQHEGVVINGQLVDKHTGMPMGAAIPKQAEPFSLSPGQTRYGPDGKPVAAVVDANKPFSVGADGALVPNPAYQQYEINKAKSGATNANNSVSMAGPENQYNKDIGAGLAKDSLSLVDSAKQAPEVIRNAQMIRKALDGGAITGTGAEARLALEKALATTGLVGEGRAADTQALMAGLGKLTLSGIKTSGLGGGNGFTDKDRAFLEGAISGTIDSTPQNLRRVADLSERVANANYEKGSKVLKRWGADPSLRGVVQDTQLDPLPAAPEKPAAKPTTELAAQLLDALPTANASNKGKRFRDTQTGKVLISNGMQWKEVQ